MNKLNNLHFEDYNEHMKKINTVCYQGLPFSYSEITSKVLFKNKQYINMPTFEDVFEAIYENKGDVGVLPIENSTSGYINEVYDLLLKYNLYINYSYIKKINHCLACISTSEIGNIREVYSHPQAIIQCRDYINRHNLKPVYQSNTAVAAQKISEIKKSSIGCICSTEAAKEYGLKIIEENINDNKQNSTKFIAISKFLWKNPFHNRISIVFSLPHETGSLAGLLSKFSYYGINLTSVYSRPTCKTPWEYMFYLDFEGNLINENIDTILYELNMELPYIKILGSYQI